MHCQTSQFISLCKQSISDQLKQIGYLGQFSNSWFQLDIKRTAIGSNPVCAMLDCGNVTDEHTLEINQSNYQRIGMMTKICFCVSEPITVHILTSTQPVVKLMDNFSRE